MTAPSLDDRDAWRLTRAMEVCASSTDACGPRDCIVGKSCAVADEIHDAMLEAEQRATTPVATPDAPSGPTACEQCGGESFGGGTDAYPRPWCNDCGAPQPGWPDDAPSGPSAPEGRS